MVRKTHMHLMVTDRCNHDCKFCCNKQYDIEQIPVAKGEEMFDTEILFLTGGEPFYVAYLNNFAQSIKAEFKIPHVVVYTSGSILEEYLKMGGSLSAFDGLNICPKTTDEFYAVRRLLHDSNEKGIAKLTMNRLYLFPKFYRMYEKGLIQVPSNFEVHKRTWQQEFEPNGGIFRRLRTLL